MNLRSTPILRLELSRERCRNALRASSPASDGATSPAAAGTFSTLLDGLTAIPGASALVDAVRIWWMQHPLRVVAVIAGEAVKAAVLPLAQRSPVRLVLGAVLLGGLIAWSRPWRWTAAPALFAGLLPQVLVKIMAQVPPISWLDLLNALAQPQNKPEPSSP